MRPNQNRASKIPVARVPTGMAHGRQVFSLAPNRDIPASISIAARSKNLSSDVSVASAHRTAALFSSRDARWDAAPCAEPSIPGCVEASAFFEAYTSPGQNGTPRNERLACHFSASQVLHFVAFRGSLPPMEARCGYAIFEAYTSPGQNGTPRNEHLA